MSRARTSSPRRTWSTRSCSGVRVTSPIRFAFSKTSWTGDGFNKLKVVFDDPNLDIAILQSAINTKTWLTVSPRAPREGDEVGLYGYPLVEFGDLSRATAFALGRLGMVAGFGRHADARGG